MERSPKQYTGKKKVTPASKKPFNFDLSFLRAINMLNFNYLISELIKQNSY